MPDFIFRFLVSNRGGGQPLTSKQLDDMKESLQGMLREATHPTEVDLESLRFHEGTDGTKMIIVEGTTSNIEELRGNTEWPVRYLEEEKTLPQGWTVTEYPKFIANAPDAPQDPEVEGRDEDPSGGRRRRRKRSRKVTRRHRKRRGTRKL